MKNKMKLIALIIVISSSTLAVQAQTDSSMNTRSRSNGQWQDTIMSRQKSDSLRYNNSGTRRDNFERYGTDSTRMQDNSQKRSNGMHNDSPGNSDIKNQGTDTLNLKRTNDLKKGSGTSGNPANQNRNLPKDSVYRKPN